MSEEEKGRLATTIAGAMQGVRQEVIDRQLAHFDAADEDYGRRVREALKRAQSAGGDGMPSGTEAGMAVRDAVPEGEAKRD